ncbi:UvrD-helicase domain-containing protein [Amycolatopsis sp., V23-08]|uniref:UvrD-helicase domain-containing protein n=1 Tax=Amycolatopsis heterodermiae TaxID=3110235 RepID=A0ABU5QWK5_9PSEU|nr:UvrD-helicase domain-containing protein [Amycolatopsis sp., V23-08]MEA5358286.1 UvrD-helicase domain-containing protein [Amycolatopsis sp., V23-08]
MTEPDPYAEAAVQQQQDAVRHPAPLYVQACPGAGKTRVIVDRHLAEGQGRRGRAVLSFTNVACSEVARRCHEAGKPELAEFPNFVGTIDTFLWRYLLRPFLGSGKLWRRIDSWDRIDASTEVGTGPNRHKVFLNDFQWSREPGAARCTARLQARKRAIKSYNALSKLGLLDDAAKAAVDKQRALVAEGYVTGHEIRIFALHNLQRRQDQIIAMLSGRFREIVIDEAQDCSAHDLAILGQLHHAGMPLVFVCDPDQAIYEFRGALPARIREFGKSLEGRVDLRGNWRSSPAICGLAATLRPTATARPADSPVGPNRTEPAGILLIGTVGSQPDEALAVFTEQADALGIRSENRVVLAHAGTSLPTTTGASGSQPPAHHAARVAWAAAVAKSNPKNATLRHVAYDILQRALLRYWFAEADTTGRSVEAICELVGLETWRIRQLSGQLIGALPDLDQGTFTDWCKEAGRQLGLLPPFPGMKRLDNSGSLVARGKLRNKTPRNASGVPPRGSASGVRASVVHQVKGEEEDAVLLLIPSDSRIDGLVDAWTTGNHPPNIAENLRVLYVAATRAKRLLAIALPEDAQDLVAAHLKLRDVPFELTTTRRSD